MRVLYGGIRTCCTYSIWHSWFDISLTAGNSPVSTYTGVQLPIIGSPHSFFFSSNTIKIWDRRTCLGLMVLELFWPPTKYQSLCIQKSRQQLSAFRPSISLSSNIKQWVSPQTGAQSQNRSLPLDQASACVWTNLNKQWASPQVPGSSNSHASYHYSPSKTFFVTVRFLALSSFCIFF